MRRLALAIALAALLIPPPAIAAAKSFPVTSTGNAGPGSLRAAIQASNASPEPDIVGISAMGTIDLEEALPDVSGDLEIRGPGADLLTVRRASGNFRIFRIVCCPDVTISGLTISNGLAESGGGIESTGTLVLERVAVTGNEAVASGGSAAVAEGGGILSFGSLVLRESTVSGNRAAATGGLVKTVAGGAGVAGFAPATIEGSTIAGNAASASSGGGEVSAGGGGLSLSGEATSVRSSTVARNSATAEAGSSRLAEGANLLAGAGVLVRDTIVSDPHGSSSCAGPVASGGFNIDSGTSCGFLQLTDLPAADPGLAAGLAANGGPTPTIALLPGGQAIDHGNALDATADQRGMRRPVDFGAIPNVPGGDGSDVGAYELQDEVAPAVKIETGPLPRTRRRFAKLTFSSNEPDASFECRVDRQPFAPCTSPFIRHASRNRTHTFEVEAIDMAGNRGAPAWRNWRVMRKRRRHRHHHHHHESHRSPWVN
jgi:hypothetical protein